MVTLIRWRDGECHSSELFMSWLMLVAWAISVPSATCLYKAVGKLPRTLKRLGLRA